MIADDVMLSRRLLPDSPEPRLEFAVESLRLFTLFEDSPLPRLIESVLAVMTVPPMVGSRLEPHSLAKSDRNSDMAVADESRLFVEILFMPESAELSRRFLTDDSELSVAVFLPQGKLLARSASVSRLHNWACLLPRRLDRVVDPPHSRRMSVN